MFLTLMQQAAWQLSVTLTDEVSGVAASLLLNHSRVIASIADVTATVKNNTITTAWRRSEGYPSHLYHNGLIVPKFSLSEEVKHRVIYSSDYFDQCVMSRLGGTYSDFSASIILEEPFTGELTVALQDKAQGASA